MIKKFNEMEQVNERFGEERTELKNEIINGIHSYFEFKYGLSDTEIDYIFDEQIEKEINTLSENILLKIDTEQ